MSLITCRDQEVHDKFELWTPQECRKEYRELQNAIGLFEGTIKNNEARFKNYAYAENADLEKKKSAAQAKLRNLHQHMITNDIPFM